MPDEEVTDETPIKAMMESGDPNEVARNVILLFARRVGRQSTEEEIEQAIWHSLHTLTPNDAKAR
ncbi:MAG TPA: hypothetical protein VJG32_17885 [Anaerolineae bacterium]|nr:hypothetical protein [Anaerolineae bacterium]